MDKHFYITTPIYYVNDVPHIGHAYTTLACDVLARYKRARGYEVFFLTGTDEHGQKVEKAAVAKGETPLELADRVMKRFQALWEKLGISNSDFIRTSQERHKKGVRALFELIQGKGDIYLGDYEDWYCTPCETFWTELQLMDGNCPDCGRPTEKLKEESYFFRMSKYQQALLDHIEANPDFIQPRSRRNEIVNFVKEGLRDLSISRTTFSWGIPVPGNEKHVVYVWFDALTNYITALGYPDDPEGNYAKFWPVDVHVIGKDILRFHTVYWPTFLLAAGLPLPKKVFAHGWWTVEGQKMSKSLANVVEPNMLVDKYGVDAIRYFLLREVPFGLDGDFSHSALVHRINSDLANDLGNLVCRSTAMLAKYFDGVLPAAAAERCRRCGLHRPLPAGGGQRRRADGRARLQQGAAGDLGTGQRRQQVHRRHRPLGAGQAGGGPSAPRHGDVQPPRGGAPGRPAGGALHARNRRPHRHHSRRRPGGVDHHRPRRMGRADRRHPDREGRAALPAHRNRIRKTWEETLPHAGRYDATPEPNQV